MSLSDTVTSVSTMLSIAKGYGLECEVVASALEYMKANPDCNIIDAIQAGLSEWDL
jgi:hypothetical protein